MFKAIRLLIQVCPRWFVPATILVFVFAVIVIAGNVSKQLAGRVDRVERGTTVITFSHATEQGKSDVAKQIPTSGPRPRTGEL